MKAFDLEAAKAGKPVCTRDGRKARIVCFDRKSKQYPIIAVIYDADKECEDYYVFTNEGEFNADGKPYHLDLFMANIHHEGWINLYRDIYGIIGPGDIIHPSEKEAINYSGAFNHKVATVKIEWDD